METQNDEIENEEIPAAAYCAEEEDSGEAKNCSRPPLCNIRNAPD